MTQRLRAAVIGLGVGEQHIAGYLAHPACDVVALCDLDEARLATVGAKYPAARTTRSAAEVLADPAIDVVSVATYDDVHAAQVLAALRHNKHVFVEKPLCLHPAEAAAIRAELAARPHLRLSSNLILRHCPRFLALKQLLAAGTLGEVYYVEADYNYGRLAKLTDGWRGRLDYYSVYHGGGVHLVDLLLWLLQDTVVAATAFGTRICTRDSAFRFDDLVASLLRFRRGAVAKVTANFGCVMPHFHELRVFGTKGTFVNQREYGLVYRSRDLQDTPERLAAPYPGYHKGALLYPFLEAILGRGEPEVTAADVFATMSVCFAVEQAASSGTVINLA